MSEENERPNPQDIFLMSLPVGMRQAYLSQKHLEKPGPFSHVLIVDGVAGVVNLGALNVAGGLTGHPDARLPDEVLAQIAPLLAEYGRTADNITAEELALELAAQISGMIHDVSEQITGKVAVWFFEPNAFGDKTLRVITRKLS